MMTADQLAADHDTLFEVAALSMAMGAALLEGEDAVEIMVDLMAMWPDEVPDQAAVVGYRVAMILAETKAITPDELGAISAHLLSVDTVRPEQEADTSE